jgi:N6-adenosine-specific RNA methylase IME4
MNRVTSLPVGTALPSGPFEGLPARAHKVILADPAWRFSAGPNKNPSKHYQTMRFDDICALPVGDLAHPDGCRLFLWITMPLANRMQEVLDAWGFRYSTARVWIKLWPREDEMFIYPSSIARGPGYEVIGNAELLVVAKRGRPQRLGGKKPGSVIFGRRREHSRKPDIVRDEIARLFDGPRIEIFARQSTEGWATWGNQKSKFDAASEAYNGQDDFAKSLEVGYAAIRERKAAGGPGWEPKT